MQFGVQLYSLRERAEKGGAEEVLRLVSEAGYDGVDACCGYRGYSS